MATRAANLSCCVTTWTTLKTDCVRLSGGRIFNGHSPSKGDLMFILRLNESLLYTCQLLIYCTEQTPDQHCSGLGVPACGMNMFSPLPKLGVDCCLQSGVSLFFILICCDKEPHKRSQKRHGSVNWSEMDRSCCLVDTYGTSWLPPGFITSIAVIYQCVSAVLLLYAPAMQMPPPQPWYLCMPRPGVIISCQIIWSVAGDFFGLFPWRWPVSGMSASPLTYKMLRPVWF